MIPIIEDYLSELLEEKLAYLKSNPNHIDLILNTSQDRRDRLKNYIQGNRIKIIKGYPRTPAELPCICILLSKEEETQEGLGDYGDAVDTMVEEVTHEVEVLGSMGGMGSISGTFIRVPNVPIVEVISIVNNELSYQLQPEDYVVTNAELGEISFTNPSVAEIGDSMTVTYTRATLAQENIRVMYDSNYRIEAWAENGDFVVELYHIMKWALLSGRSVLINDKELVRQRLSGADFEPAPNFFPTFVYRRALNFWCQFSVSTPNDEEPAPYIESIETAQVTYSDSFGGGDVDE